MKTCTFALKLANITELNSDRIVFAKKFIISQEKKDLKGT